MKMAIIFICISLIQTHFLFSSFSNPWPKHEEVQKSAVLNPLATLKAWWQGPLAGHGLVVKRTMPALSNEESPLRTALKSHIIIGDIAIIIEGYCVPLRWLNHPGM